MTADERKSSAHAGSVRAGHEPAMDALPVPVGPDAMTTDHRVLLLLTAVCASLVTLWAGNAATSASLLGCLSALWGLLGITARALGAVAFSLGVLSLYATGAWLAALTGRRYPPFYPEAVLFATSRSTTATVAAALALVSLVLSLAGARKAVDVWRSFATTAARPRAPWAHLLGLAISVLVLRDLVVLAPILGDVLTSPRRAYADLLWVTSSLNVQLLYLCAAALATLAWPHLGRGLKWLLIPPLLGALALQFSVGSRKEVLLGLVIAVPVLWLRHSRRGVLTACVAVAVGVQLALPALRDADAAVVPTEFALPGYASVAGLRGQVSRTDIPYDFWAGIWALVPSPLRLVEVDIDIGRPFAEYGFQSVGIGATPWLEAVLAFPAAPLLAAVLVVATLHLTWQFLLARVPVIAVTALPFLVLLGRSTFWVTVFGAFYLTLLTVLVARLDAGAGGGGLDRRSGPTGQAMES